MGTYAKSEDLDEMQHNAAAFHQGLHCLLRLKQPSGTEIHHNIENSTCDPLKYTMDSPVFIVSICMGKSIRIQGVKCTCASSGATGIIFGLSLQRINFYEQSGEW